MKNIFTLILVLVSILGLAQSPTVKDIKVVDNVRFITNGDSLFSVKTYADSLLINDVKYDFYEPTPEIIFDILTATTTDTNEVSMVDQFGEEGIFIEDSTFYIITVSSIITASDSISNFWTGAPNRIFNVLRYDTIMLNYSLMTNLTKSSMSMNTDIYIIPELDEINYRLKFYARGILGETRRFKLDYKITKIK